MNAQQKQWAGEFGDAYIARNQVDWWQRVPFWSRVVGQCIPFSITEYGCNAGWNLMAIRALGFPIRLRGVEVNPKAASRAVAAGFDVTIGTEIHKPSEMVFTAGVLIHVAPADLKARMQAIAAMADRWVLAIEYEHGFEKEIEYHGQRDMLWKRPFGEMYEAAVPGLKVVGDPWPAEGFDRCTAWLLEKQ